MKKSVAILFVGIFLCANTEMGQLLKLPNLLHHFIAHHGHRTNHETIGFLAFLHQHYNGESNHADNAGQEHESLPFKTIHCHSLTIMALVQHNILFQGTSLVISTQKAEAPYLQQRYTSQLFGGIWQPPKFG